MLVNWPDLLLHVVKDSILSGRKAILLCFAETVFLNSHGTPLASCPQHILLHDAIENIVQTDKPPPWQNIEKLTTLASSWNG
jgi:hypothetical protein